MRHLQQSSTAGSALLARPEKNNPEDLLFFLGVLLPPRGNCQKQQILHDLHRSLTDVAREMDVECTEWSRWVSLEALPLYNMEKYVTWDF